jgi:hypothetical protein
MGHLYVSVLPALTTNNKIFRPSPLLPVLRKKNSGNFFEIIIGMRFVMEMRHVFWCVKANF